MSLCNLPTFSFGFSLPGIPLFAFPSLPTFALGFSMTCPLD